MTATAFAPRGQPDRTLVEAALVDGLRASDAWLPALSIVAVDAAGVVGTSSAAEHGWIQLRYSRSGHPKHQRRGVGVALMHAVPGEADALDEPIVVLLGDPRYYLRFRLRLAEDTTSGPRSRKGDRISRFGLSPRSLPHFAGSSRTLNRGDSHFAGAHAQRHERKCDQAVSAADRCRTTGQRTLLPCGSRAAPATGDVSPSARPG